VLEQVLALNTPPLGFTGGEGHVRDILKWDARASQHTKKHRPARRIAMRSRRTL